MNDPFKNMREQEQRRREKRQIDEFRKVNERARKDFQDFIDRSNKTARDMAEAQRQRREKTNSSKTPFEGNRFLNPDPTDSPIFKSKLDLNKPPAFKSKSFTASKPTYQPSTARGGESNLLATLIGFGIFLCFAAVVVALMIS